MKLNCRPGDLAVIYRVTKPDMAWVIGKVVRVTSLVPNLLMGGRPAWYLEQSVPNPYGIEWNCAHDDILRPIRNPGDDAVDESKAWLPPVPSRIKESA